MEIVIVGAILIGILLYNNVISGKKFFEDNDEYFKMLKEDDYDFLVAARYGEKVDANILFNKRIKQAGIVIVVFLFIFLSELNLLNITLSVVVGFLTYKLPYNKLKKYYKAHLHDIDVMLP